MARFEPEEEVFPFATLDLEPEQANYSRPE